MLLKELGEEETYYYHPDHLGSVSVVSNYKGEPYERVEYLPLGELWTLRRPTPPQATYPSGSPPRSTMRRLASTTTGRATTSLDSPAG